MPQWVSAEYLFWGLWLRGLAPRLYDCAKRIAPAYISAAMGAA
jgi:hypothetical protein